MKIIKNGDEFIGIEQFSINAFSPEQQQEFLKVIKESGLTLEEAYEKIGKSISDISISLFEPQNNTFPEIYINKELKLQTDWKSKAIKYQKFYEYIKHLLRNANLEENIVRRKIEEMEKGIENED
ncbi:hypothetical protein ACLGL2_00870 [Parvimonas sp. G1641]|uniref:hypothetical protein n=1 Tax=Parvimonas sp. G1641 TaxID=3388846 RepID=UPI00398032F1